MELLLGPVLTACCPLDASWSWDYSRAALANYGVCKTKNEAPGAWIREAASRRACSLDSWPLNPGCPLDWAG